MQSQTNAKKFNPVVEFLAWGLRGRKASRCFFPSAEAQDAVTPGFAVIGAIMWTMFITVGGLLIRVIRK